MLICPEPIARSLTRRCAEPGNLSAADSGAAVAQHRHGIGELFELNTIWPAAALRDHNRRTGSWIRPSRSNPRPAHDGAQRAKPPSWEPPYSGWLPFWLPTTPSQGRRNPVTSAPGRIRTRDPLLRRQLLCPAELRALGDHCAWRISRLGHVRVAVCCSSDHADSQSLRTR